MILIKRKGKIMDKNLEPLFTPWKIGNVEIKNRIVMTSMGGTSLFGWMEINHFDKEASKFILDKAKNNVGLILPGIQPVYNPMFGQWLYKNKGMYKDLKEFCNDLKKIYTSNNEKIGYEELQKVKDKWKDKYPSALKTWEDNWDAICPFFQFSDSIRKIMYTTNTIESLNRQFRKYTKTKSVFPSDMSLMKCLFLSTKNIAKKWTQPYRNWGPKLSELSIMFDNRI